MNDSRDEALDLDPAWIRLTAVGKRENFWVAIEQIVALSTRGSGTTLLLKTGEALEAREPMSEVVDRLRSALLSPDED